MGGQFVSYKDCKIWIFDTEVKDVVVNGKETTYEEQAKIKFHSGFLNFSITPKI